MMIPRVSKSVIVVPIILVILVFVSAGVYMHLQGDFIAEQARRRLVEHVNETYGISMSIREGQMLGVSNIVFNDIKIDMQPDTILENGIKTIHVPRITVNFNPLYLLINPEAIFDSIGTINLDGPHIVFRSDVQWFNPDLSEGNKHILDEETLVEYMGSREEAKDTDGEILSQKDLDAGHQLAAVFASGTKDATQMFPDDFSTNITINGGTAEWLAMVDDTLMRVENIYDMAGDLKVKTELPVDANISFKVSGDKGAKFFARGSINAFTPGISNVYVDYYDLDVTYLHEKGLDFHGLIEFFEGKLSGDMVMSLEHGEETNVRGTAEFVDGQGRYDFFEGIFTNIYAQFDFSTRSINIKKLTSELSSIEMELTGRISNYHDPLYDLKLISQTRGLKYFLPLIEATEEGFSIDGSGQITAEIKGHADALNIKGNANIFDGHLLQYRLDDITASYAFANEALSIDIIEGSSYNGQLSGEALFDLSSEDVVNYMLDLEGYEMDSSELLKDFHNIFNDFGLDGYSIEGMVSGNIIIRTDARGIPVVTGSINGRDGNIVGFDFDSLETGFWGENNRLILDYMTLSSGEGNIHLRGIIDETDGYKLDITAEKISPEEYLSSVGVTEVEGLTNFVGKVIGGFDNPVVEGALRVLDGNIYGQRFDELIGNIVFSDNILELNDVNMFRRGMSHSASGNILFASEPKINLNVTTKQAKIRDFFDAEQLPLDIQGDLSGSFLIQGYLNSLFAEGKVSLTNGYFLGQSLDEAELDFHLENGKVYFHRFTGLLNGSRIELSGILGDNDMELSYDISNYDIENIPAGWLGEGIYRGTANATGNIKGTTSRPIVTADIASHDFAIGEYEFDSVNGAFDFSNEELRISNLSFHSDDSRYFLDGVLTYGDGSFQGVGIGDAQIIGRFNNADIYVLTNLPGFHYAPELENIARELSGGISGEIQIGRKENNLNSTFRIYSHNMAYRGIEFDNIFVNGNVEDGNVNLEGIRVVNDEGFLDINGSIDEHGNISASAEGYSLELLDLIGLMNIEQSVTGTIDLNMSISGTLSNPLIQCSFEASNGLIERMRYRSASGDIMLEEGVIHFIDVIARDNRQSIKITGAMPLSDAISEFEQVEDEMDLYIKSDNANLGLVSLFVPDLEDVKGDAEILLHITSGLKTPVINGHISLERGYLRHKYLTDSLREIRGDIELEDNRINLNINGMIENEGSFNLSGDATIENLILKDLDLDVQADGIKMAVDAFDGYIDGLLNIKGPVHDFVVSGTLDFYNGNVNLMEPDIGSEFPISPHLEITARVDKGVSLKGPGVDVPIYGQLNLRGTINDPTVRGRINARRGYFEVFGTRFSLEYGTADFFDLTGYIPRINVMGQARAGGTAILIQLDGRPDDLQINLSSDPPRTTEEIISLLAWPGAITQLLEGDVEGVVQEQLIGYVDSQIQQLISATIGHAVQDAFDLDDFFITSDMRGKIELEAGKYIFDNIYVGYTRNIQDIDIEEIWDIEYNVTDYFNLGASIKGDGEIKVGFEAKFEF